jgi:uncharacterized surface protein with fasciclin (FAS1) repeats
MTSRLRTLASGAALAIALGGLAACGGGDEAATTEDTAAAPATDTAGSVATTPSPDAASAAASGEAPVVGGAPMLPTRTIVQNASEASNLTTLVSAVTAAGLGETLSGPGPFTVFAPTNEAFEKIPAATRTSLMEPAQKQALGDILKYHVVSGNLDAAALTQQIQAGGGTATLTTVNGAKLTARAANGGVQLTDAAGGTSMVTQADVRQSNGVVHVIDTVLMPAAS